jgi:hypothetical protein
MASAVPLIKGALTNIETESQLLLHIANGISNKIQDNFNKWKHRINDFKENLAATAEPVPADMVTEPE